MSVVDKVDWMFSVPFHVVPIFSTREKCKKKKQQPMYHTEILECIELSLTFSPSFWSSLYWHLCTSASWRNARRPDIAVISKLYLVSLLRITPFRVKLHFCSVVCLFFFLQLLCFGFFCHVTFVDVFAMFSSWCISNTSCALVCYHMSFTCYVLALNYFV